MALRAACLAIAAAVLAPTPARADFWCWLLGDCDGGRSNATAPRSAAPAAAAPEVDPGTVANAIALAAGGAALLGDRVRRRRR